MSFCQIISNSLINMPKEDVFNQIVLTIDVNQMNELIGFNTLYLKVLQSRNDMLN